MFSRFFKRNQKNEKSEFNSPPKEQPVATVAALCEAGEFENAISLATKYANLTRQSYGEQHQEYITSLQELAGAYAMARKTGAAEVLYKKVLEIEIILHGEQSEEYLASLDLLAELLLINSGYFDTTTSSEKPRFNFIKQTQEPISSGEVHDLEPILRLTFKTAKFVQKCLYGEALRYAMQAPDLARQVLGEQNPLFATTLSYLANIHKEIGNYPEAETLYKQALEVERSELGEKSSEFAVTLTNLADLYSSAGNYQTAEPLYKQAITILRSTGNEKDLAYAVSLNNLAQFYVSIYNYEAAETLYKQSLEILQTELGENDPVYADALDNLAELYRLTKDFDAVLSLVARAKYIRRNIFGEDHPKYADSLMVDASLIIAMVDPTESYEEALPLYTEAALILRTALGEQNGKYAGCLDDVASTYISMGNYRKAEPLYKQSLEIKRVALGENHPEFANSLYYLAGLYAAMDREVDAFNLMKQALAIDDLLIGQIFSISSENQRSIYISNIAVSLDLILSLVSGKLAASTEAVRSAMSIILRRKALGAEALTSQRDAVLSGKYPEAANFLQKLAILRAQTIKKTLAGPEDTDLQEHLKLIAEWNAQREQLEANLARKIPEMNLAHKLQSIDNKTIAKALPNDSILIEFVYFNAMNFKAVLSKGESRWQPGRYLAFVLTSGESEVVEMIDLGEAELIDQMIMSFRENITGERERGNRGLGAVPTGGRRATGDDIGTKLREAIFDPLLKAIGNRKKLMIAPDGDIARLPFEVLPLNNGLRVIDEYKISYLGTGRDVIRSNFKSNRQSARSLVIADPDFDFAANAVAGETEPVNSLFGRNSLKHTIVNFFEPLPATKLEGKNIAKILDAELWIQGEALEASLKKRKSPLILHLATHGFFLEDQKRDTVDDFLSVPSMNFSESGLMRLTQNHFENPLLRSGLVLAGANTWLRQGKTVKDAEDGLLTAEDVTGLDLLDTELVVLSACETGLGEVHLCEGVFGLRRAFILAGAKTLVMSLWKVPDEQTKELMEDFYHRLLSGETRSNALREAQLAMKLRHPDAFFWGAFICQGDVGPLLVESR